MTPAPNGSQPLVFPPNHGAAAMTFLRHFNTFWYPLLRSLERQILLLEQDVMRGAARASGILHNYTHAWDVNPARMVGRLNSELATIDRLNAQRRQLRAMYHAAAGQAFVEFFWVYWPHFLWWRVWVDGGHLNSG